MTTQDNVEIGSIVRLLSGGPEMTVLQIRTATTEPEEITGYDCIWFAGKKLEKGHFRVGTVQIVEKEK